MAFPKGASGLYCLESTIRLQPGDFRMTHDSSADHAGQPAATDDAAEAVVHYMPYILPLAGAVMMFLLAFIAVNMA